MVLSKFYESACTLQIQHTYRITYAHAYKAVRFEDNMIVETWTGKKWNKKTIIVRFSAWPRVGGTRSGSWRW